MTNPGPNSSAISYALTPISSGRRKIDIGKLAAGPAVIAAPERTLPPNNRAGRPEVLPVPLTEAANLRTHGLIRRLEGLRF
jgi:hypothetical protein